MVSVDGTDFCIPQIIPWSKAWYSHKFDGPGLCYDEVAVCIHTGAIVWVHGPFPPGDYPDISIFRHVLIFMLDSNEQVEANNGYRGEYPRRCKILDPLGSIATAFMRR